MKIAFKKRRSEITFLLVLTLGIALRVAAMSDALDSTDEVNFALALERYDLVRHQPHFPGYPLYVLAARGCALFLPAERALALPSLLGAIAIMVAVAYALRERVDRTTALLATALVAVAPPLVAVGAAASSDGLALGLFAAAFALVASARAPLVAGALAALALGARPSLLVLLVSFAGAAYALRARWQPLLLGFSIGLAAWLLPLCAMTGPVALVQLGLEHVRGHFTTWGGAIAADEPGLVRAGRLLHAVTAGMAPTLVAAAVALALRPRMRGPARLLGLLASPYALWIFLAQNIDRARHAAPLTAVLCVAAALAIGELLRAPTPGWLRPVLVGGVVAASLLALPRAVPPWRRDAARFIEARLGHERVVVLGTHLPRVVSYYTPSLRVGQARDGHDVARVLDELGEDITVVTSSEIPLDPTALAMRPLARFGDRTLYAGHLRTDAP